MMRGSFPPKLSVREANLEDVCILRNNLRREDRDELWVASRFSPEDGLLWAYVQSSGRRLTIVREERPIAMFGVAPAMVQGVAQAGCIWLLGTEEIAKFPVEFVRITRQWAKTFLQDHDLLFNWVDCRYGKAVRWLEAIGARLDDPHPFGPDQLPFRRFCFVKEVTGCVA